MSDYDALEYLVGGSMVLILVLGLLVIGFYVFYIVCLWKLFKKAGKNGWEAIIPFYSTWVLIEIAGLNWWYFLIAISGTLVSIVGLDSLSWLTNLASLAVNFFVFYNLAKKMHKETISTAILGTLFSGVMIPVLGLSKNYQYDSSVAVSPNGPIGDDKSQSTNTTATPERFCLGCGQKLKPNTAFCENCGKKVE